jgi:hypothetical protein
MKLEPRDLILLLAFIVAGFAVFLARKARGGYQPKRRRGDGRRPNPPPRDP